MNSAAPSGAESFIRKWQNVAVLPATEIATAQSFVRDLCDVLGVPHPHPTEAQDYQFERPIKFAHGDGSTSAGRIDCYKRGAFVLEAKKLRASGSPNAFDAAQTEIDATVESEAALALKAAKRAWPKEVPAQAKALSDLLAEAAAPMSLDQIAARFAARGRWRERLEPMLAMLVVLGKAQQEGESGAIRYRRSN
jgi:hypothetical protein